MDRKEWLLQRIDTSKQIVKRWKTREEEWRKELLLLLDEDIAYLDTGVLEVRSPTPGEAERTAQTQLGDMFEIVGLSQADEDGVWILEWRKRRKYTSTKISAGEYTANKIVYNKSPEIDLDKLKAQSPEIWDRIVRQESKWVLDESVLEEVLAESPEAFEAVQRALVIGKPVVRLDVKRSNTNE